MHTHNRVCGAGGGLFVNITPVYHFEKPTPGTLAPYPLRKYYGIFGFSQEIYRIWGEKVRNPVTWSGGGNKHGGCLNMVHRVSHEN